jgi:hypothetical protein
MPSHDRDDLDAGIHSVGLISMFLALAAGVLMLALRRLSEARMARQIDRNRLGDARELAEKHVQQLNGALEALKESNDRVAELERATAKRAAVEARKPPGRPARGRPAS